MELFKLLGTIAIDTADMEKAFKKARQDGDNTQKKLSTTFSKIGNAAVTFGKTVAVGVGAGITAVAGMVTKSVQAYAEYEQLVGGIETLFKGSADTVIKYAENAYKTAGLSANDYMETVTSFSASLLQSLGGDTKAAADYADMAITDMSDNANKMGTSMEMIQNAYQGFAKQNYTMLDNLKLGYGGTKEEMQRLIDDANKLKKANGETADLTIKSYADIVEAIHMVQTEMGITGTTAKEAEGTISGSIAMTKGAWENLMVGISQGNADIPTLVSNLVSSGTQVLKNIAPVAKQALEAIPAAISEISPQVGSFFQKIIDIAVPIFEKLVGAIEPTFEVINNIFTLISENTGILITLAAVVGTITTAIGLYNAVAAVKAAMAAAEVTTVWGLVSAYAAQAVAMAAAMAPYLAIAAAIAAVIAIGVALYKNWDTVKEKCSQTWGKIKEIISSAVDKIKGFFSGVIDFVKNNWQGLLLLLVNPFAGAFKLLYDNCEGFRNKVNEIFGAIKDFLASVWGSVKDKTIEIWNAVTGFLSTAWETIKNVVTVGVMFIGSILSAAFQIITLPFRFIWENCKEYVFAAWEWIKSTVSAAINAVKNVISKVMNTIKSVFTTVWNAIKGVFTKAWNAIVSFLTPILNKIKSVITTVWNGIKTTISTVLNAIKSVVTTVWNAIKSAVTTALNAIKSVVTKVWNSIKSAVTTAVNAIKTTVTKIWNSIKSTITSVVNGIKTTVSNVFNTIKSTISSKITEAKNKVFSIFDSIKSGISSKINAAKDVVSSAINKIKGLFNFSWSLPKIKLPHFKIKGKFSLDPPSVPKLSIDWYKKAMQNPMLLTEPTIFGYGGGKLLGGGEAGTEVVSGANTLMTMICNAVATQNGELAAVLYKILDAILSLDANMGGNLREALSGVGFEVNRREFARLVKAVN